MEFSAEKLTVLFFILIHRVIEAPKVRPSVVVGFLVKKASNSKMTTRAAYKNEQNFHAKSSGTK